MKSVEVRSKLLETLRLDLVGPWKGAVSKEGYEYEQEILTQAPSRWYLTGFLVPVEASQDQRYDETAKDEIDELEATTAASDDSGTPEPASAQRTFFPSSMGMSIIVPGDSTKANVFVRWGEYIQAPAREEDAEPGGSAHSVMWKRNSREELIALSFENPPPLKEHPVPQSKGLVLVISVRPLTDTVSFPPGSKSVALFLVNRKKPTILEKKDEAFVFQVEHRI